jgi:hypothetical protein
MRAFLAWTVAAGLSALLGVALYTTSLQGSTTGYQEAVMSPRPVPTVVKTRTKIVRKPAKTKVVHVPQSVPPPTTPRVTTPRVTTQSSAVSAAPRRSTSDEREREDDSDEHEREDEDD